MPYAHFENMLGFLRSSYILADLNLVGSPHLYIICKYEILVDFNLAVAKVDCQTAKFPAIQYITSDMGNFFCTCTVIVITITLRFVSLYKGPH